MRVSPTFGRIALVTAALIGCGEDSNSSRPNPQTPKLLATGLQMPIAVALDNSFVYIADSGDGSIAKLPKGTTQVETLAITSPGLAGLAVSGDSVYVTNRMDGTVARIPASGGPPQPVATQQDRPTRIVAAAGAVYWLNQAINPGTGSVMARLPSGDVVSIATNQASPVGLTVDDSSVYWANTTTGIWKAPLSGGPAQQLLTVGQGQVDIAITDGRLYITGPNAPLSFITTDGTASGLALLQPVSGSFSRMTVENGQLYLLSQAVAQSMPSDAIWVASPYRSKQQLVPMVVGLPTVTALAVDETTIYWTEAGTGANGALVAFPR